MESKDRVPLFQYRFWVNRQWLRAAFKHSTCSSSPQQSSSQCNLWNKSHSEQLLEWKQQVPAIEDVLASLA